MGVQPEEEAFEGLSVDEKIAPLQAQELDRRLAAMLANPDEGSTWEETVRELRAGR